MADSPLPWLHWLGHASFRVESHGLVIYFDPWKLKSSVPADFVFITHDHTDHFSLEDLKRVSKPGTVVVCPGKVAARLTGYTVRAVQPGDDFDLGKLRGRAVASYNLRKPMHPRRAKNTGFILDLPEGRLYHAGDTDFIPEMKDFTGLKAALLPVGRVLFLRPTMGPKQAAEAVALMKPEYAVPMHYGSLPGSKGDGARFCKLVGARGVRMEREG